MSVVAELSVPTGRFVLEDTLWAAPGVNVEFERVVTHSQEWVMPFLWVSGDGLDAFDRAIHGDETVADATVTDEFSREGYQSVALYRVQWSESVERTVNVIFDRRGTDNLVRATLTVRDSIDDTASGRTGDRE